MLVHHISGSKVFSVLSLVNSTPEKVKQDSTRNGVKIMSVEVCDVTLSLKIGVLDLVKTIQNNR